MINIFTIAEFRAQTTTIRFSFSPSRQKSLANKSLRMSNKLEGKMKGKAKQNFFTRRWKLPLREVKHVQLQHLETICYQQSSKVCSINFFSLFMSPTLPRFFLLVLLIEHNTVDIRCFNFSYIFARIYSSANRVAISQISSFSLALYCAWKSHLEFLSLDSSDQIK